MSSHFILVGTRNFSFCRPSRGDTSTMRTDDMLRIRRGNEATRGGKEEGEEEEKKVEADGRRKGEGEKREGGGEEEGRAEKSLRRAVEKGMADMVREGRDAV